MKRTLKSLLALAGLAFIGLGSLLTASPASAAPLQTVTQGGVTCSQYATNYGKYPYTVWNCVHPNAPTTVESNMGSIVRNIPAGPIPTYLTNNNSANLNSHVQLYIFTDRNAYASFFSVTAPAANALGARTTNAAAAFSTATINSVVTDLTNYYNGHLLQQIGRLWDVQQGTQSVSTLYTTAYRYDRDWMGLQGATPHDASVAIWGATIANQFPTLGPTAILGQLYGASDPEMYGYQFERLIPGSHVVPGLETVLNTKLKKSAWGYVKNYGIGPLVNQGAVNSTDGKPNELCVEYSTNYGVNQFPQKVWECNKPWWAGAGDIDFSSASRNLHQNHQNLLTNNAIKMYSTQSIDDFVTFDGFVTPSRFGILGAANKVSKRTGIFIERINAPVPPSTTETRTNVTSTYSGTVTHELGHQLDKIWGDWSQSVGTTWRTKLNADIAALNSGGHATCAAKIDADRQDPQVGLPPVCNLAKYAGKTNYEILVLENGWNDYEMWAHAFSTGKATTVNPRYIVLVFNRFTNIKGYMSALHTSGGTPN